MPFFDKRRPLAGYVAVAFLGLGLSHAPTSAQTSNIVFLAEQYPGFAMEEDGVFTGASLDQVKEMMRVVNEPYDIELIPWARAYRLAQQQQNTCLVTTAHTEERDLKFRWIEPVFIDRTVVVTRRGSGVRPQTVEEARNFTIGSHRGDFTEELLKSKGFEKIDLSSDMPSTVRKLMNGRIPLMTLAESSIGRLQKEGLLDVDVLFAINEQSFGIACNVAFPPELAARMQAALDKLIASGTQKEIMRQYGIAPPR